MLLIDVAILLVLAQTGTLLLRTFSTRLNLLSLAARAFPVSAGTIAWLIFLSSWAGIAFKPFWVILVALILIMLLAAVLLFRQ